MYASYKSRLADRCNPVSTCNAWKRDMDTFAKIPDKRHEKSTAPETTTLYMFCGPSSGDLVWDSLSLSGI
jgi:hypothetical protein